MAVVRGTIIGLGGVVVAVAATLVSRLEWRPDSLVLPWGLVVAVTGSAAAVALARVSGRA